MKLLQSFGVLNPARAPVARHSAGLVLGLLLCSIAGAFAVPAAGTFGYDIYDLVVNDILTGPIGFVGALALIVWGATKLMTNWMLTIMCLIAGTVLIRADAIVATLGALV